MLLKRRPKNEDLRPKTLGLKRRPYGLKRRPYRLKRRSYGLKRRPYGLKRRPHGLKRRPYGLKRRPHGLKRRPREDSFPVSRAPGGSFRRLSRFLQYFATGSDTALYQDNEEYEFVECLSEENQIIDLFTHTKLQPHIKLSRCTLATRRLSSWSF